MFKLLKASLATLLLFHTLCSQLVLAGNLSIQADGNKINSLSGDASVRRLGDIQISSGTVALKGNRIDILFDSVDLTAKSGTTDRHKTLTGTCFGVTKVNKSGHTYANGFVYVDGGSGLGEIDQPGIVETVTVNDGTSCSGHIADVTSEQITIVSDGESKTIQVDAIKHVVSPRVLAMSIPFDADGVTTEAKFSATYDSKKVASKSTGASISKSTTAKSQIAKQSHPSRKKKIIVTIVVVCLIATAIAVPIAVACGGHHHHNGNNDLANQIAFRNLFARETAVAPAPAP